MKLVNPQRTAANKQTLPNSGNWRVNFFTLTVLGLTGLIVFRLFNLTIIQHESLNKTAEQQYQNPSSIAGRGNIYFSDFSSGNTRKLAAANKSTFYVYSNNKILETNPAEIAAKLATVPGIEMAGLESKLLESGKTHQVLVENISEQEAAEIRKLKVKGITVASRLDRFYPGLTLASHAVGFVGFDGRDRGGQYGIEAYYNKTLSGRADKKNNFGGGWYKDLLSRLSLKKIFGKKQAVKVVDQPDSEIIKGSDLVLTVDRNIQEFIESKLDSLIKKWSATGGTIIVQEPKSGAVLAMASSPSFDPNRYAQYHFENFINPASQELYEPGSSFKPITMSAAVDAGRVSSETTYTDSGIVQIAGYTIKNFDERSHGVQTMRQVLEKSLNTGAIYAQQKTGDDTFLNYVVAFGFGQKTGIDLSGEILGNISNLYENRKINFATASFGQGIAVTPIQLINAYSAIANGGKLMRPYIVREINSNDGTALSTKPQIIGSPINEKTARQLQSMLVDVVDRGFDKARIKGYDMAGKTGTAQIPSPAGGYLENDQFIHNFVGFAPAYDAKFAVLIKMDRPKGIRFAADSLSPVFGDVARFLIGYFKIPPTR